MAENKGTGQAPDLNNPEMRHEHADVNVWAIGKLGIALVLVTIASIILMFGVFRYFEAREGGKQLPASLFSIDSRKLPPEPNVFFNEHESQNQQDIRANEEKELNEYGWVDQAHGVVRIPIDRAMNLVVQRGLPARPASELQQPTKRPEQGQQK
jgi:hypothetical protein